MDRTKYEQYLICQERGHTHGGFVRGDGCSQCRFCGTFFKYMSHLVEFDVPEPDDGNN